jgi:membrane associated rhomboid family serine protease
VTERDTTDTDAPECYLHPGRPALLRCSRCERPICADDAIEAPVGYQCRQCAAGGQRVRHVRELLPDFTVTKVLVGIIAVLYLASQTTPLAQQFGLIPTCVGGGAVGSVAGGLVCDGTPEVWRLVTSAFLHAGLMHVAFNGLLLWRLGEMLEPTLGHQRFGALYAAGLAGGSLGVVGMAWVTRVLGLEALPLVGTFLATSPNSITVGASGAVFGLFGAAIVGLRARGVNPWRTDIGSLVLLNLVITFLVPVVSVGGHLGGFLGGLLAGRMLFVERERAARATVLTALAAVGMLLLAAFLAAGLV